MVIKKAHAVASGRWLVLQVNVQFSMFELKQVLLFFTRYSISLWLKGFGLGLGVLCFVVVAFVNENNQCFVEIHLQSIRDLLHFN